MRTPAHGADRIATRAGFTLLEMMVVMWGLGIALVLGATLLAATIRADRFGAITLRNLTWQSELADQFRTDVARTIAVPDSLGALTRGPQCLILRLHDGTHVIYQWQDGQLERTVRTGDAETRRPLPVGSQDMSVEFDRPGGDRPLLILRLIEAPPHGTARQTQISAALGGDLR
jgi:type II secretory pathway pseudopilin PulG